ncbi:MAG: ABC transporter ATP-binding protein [Alphaproteobacteria bacterium]|nr:ABC transporter ATP-binding protein [Alphaproteobacteria bacterium]
MSRIAFDRVVKRYGPHAALRSLSLDVAEGEFLSLLGPSGCGKTTALRLVAGFVTPSEGTIAIDGRDMAGVPPQRRDIGMVFQDYALFPHLTVAENVAFGLRERRQRAAAIAARVAELLALVQLPDLGGRYPAELSGGQQQRVALARALAFRPKLLLMDEPLGALDLKLREHMQVEIRRIQRSLGITTVYVTHDQGEAMAMSDRIAVMNRGRLEQLGPPEEIYERPQSRFVAAFVGKVSFLPVRVIGREGDHVRVAWAGVPLAAMPSGALPPAGAAMLVAVRPEAFVLQPEAAPADPELNALAGLVVERVYAGNLVHATVRLDGGATVVVETAADDALARDGTRVRVAWRAAKTMLLAAEDEKEAP